MADEPTQPGIAEKADKINKWAKEATEKSDPWADRLLESAKASAFTPWLIVGAVVLIIVLTVIVTK